MTKIDCSQRFVFENSRKVVFARMSAKFTFLVTSILVQETMTHEKVQLAKSKLLLSILSVAITLVMLTTSTYAWFVTEQSATMSQMQVTADIDATITFTAGDVDLDGNVIWTTSAFNTITTDNLRNAQTNNSIPQGTVGNLSCAGNLVYGSYGWQLGLYSADCRGGQFQSTLTSQLVSEPNYFASDLNFYAFDLYAHTELETTLCIKQSSIVYAIDHATSSQFDMSNAVRVAFVYFGTFDAHNRDLAFQTARSASMNDSCQVVVWEPNALSHNQDNPIPDGALQPYCAVAGASNQPFDSTTPGQFLRQMVPGQNFVYTATNFIGDVPLFDVTPGVSKLRVYLWLEGQDGDCTDQSAGCTICADLVIGILDTQESNSVGTINFGTVSGCEQMGSPLASKVFTTLPKTAQDFTQYVQAVEGYTFVGWYSDSNGQTPFNGNMEDNSTLYAKFELA